MISIQFPNEGTYYIGREIAQRISIAGLDANWSDEDYLVKIENPLLASLLQRIGNEPGVVLPFLGYGSQGNDYWFVAGENQRALDNLIAQLTRFFVPTYMTFRGNNAMLAFSGETEFQRAAAGLYHGYYALVSPKDDNLRSTIWKRMELFLDIIHRKEAAIPTYDIPQQNTYRHYYNNFNLALAAQQWDEAERYILEIQRLNLTTAENLQFLRLQWLAFQQQWGPIWAYPNYQRLAKIYVPRAVRSAMITAFHHVEILNYEQERDWKGAPGAFETNVGLLHMLLSNRYGLTQPSVVRVFAYQAVSAGDHLKLQSLQQIHGLDSETVFVLNALSELMPSKPFELQSDEQLLQTAAVSLQRQDYETAFQAAQRIRDSISRINLMIQASSYSQDVDYCEITLSAYEALYPEDQFNLNIINPFIPAFITKIRDIVYPGEEKVFIRDWLTWFERVSSDLYDSDLESALDYLEDVRDERFWNPETVTRLIDIILEFTTSNKDSEIRFFKSKIVQRALKHLAALFLQDEQYPRLYDPYDSLYQLLLDAIRYWSPLTPTIGSLFARLIDGRLRSAPSLCDEISEQFTEQYQYYRPSLNASTLEILETLSEYGASTHILRNWYYTWVATLITNPGQLSASDLTGWVRLGAWINPGEDLLAGLENSLDKQSEHLDVVSQLPKGFSIGIFTLREKSAQFVRENLLRRNPHINIELCFERNNNEIVQNIIAKSDIVVLVTPAIKHALTASINVHAIDPVYPQSSGSTSIIKAIEHRVKTIC